MVWQFDDMTHVFIFQPSDSVSSPKKQAVSFSIKYKEAEPPPIDSNKAALPVDPESDEEEKIQDTETLSRPSSKVFVLVFLI